MGGDRMKDLIFTERRLTVALSVYIAFASLVGFAMFLFEEAMQATTFAAHGYVEARDWEGLAEHLFTMKSVYNTAVVFGYCGVFINPVMGFYISHLKANAAQIRGFEPFFSNFSARVL